MGKLVAIMSGGDWYDASVEHLVLPDGIDIKKEKARYLKWYLDVWSKDMVYISFTDWLKKLGAKVATDDDIEIFEDE